MVKSCTAADFLPAELQHPSVSRSADSSPLKKRAAYSVSDCGAKRKTVAKISRFKRAVFPFGRLGFRTVHYFKTLANLSKRFAFFYPSIKITGIPIFCA